MKHKSLWKRTYKYPENKKIKILYTGVTCDCGKLVAVAVTSLEPLNAIQYQLGNKWEIRTEKLGIWVMR